MYFHRLSVYQARMACFLSFLQRILCFLGHYFFLNIFTYKSWPPYHTSLPNSRFMDYSPSPIISTDTKSLCEPKPNTCNPNHYSLILSLSIPLLSLSLKAQIPIPLPPLHTRRSPPTSYPTRASLFLTCIPLHSPLLLCPHLLLGKGSLSRPQFLLG